MKLEAILVNQEFQDPVLMVPIPQRAGCILFDLGYCFRLKVRDIQRIERVFISHTHIDHFAGFDHILRMSLDQDKTIHFYGPPGIIGNIRGKLSGYAWNLRENIHLSFAVTEVRNDRLLKITFNGNEGFENGNPPEETPWNPGEPIVETPEISVYTVFLEHRMPVLGYRLNGAPSINADTEMMKKMDLEPGRWVGQLKEMAMNGIKSGETITIGDEILDAEKTAKKLIHKTPGTSIAYVVDTVFNKRTAGDLKDFLKGVDHFYCECAYLKSEKNLARLNCHMTASQSAALALQSDVGCLYPFHFSRRYDGEYQKFYTEARLVFPRVQQAKKYTDL